MSVKIRWVIAHEPEELFVRSARWFVEELDRRQPGKFDVEIMTKTGFAKKYNDGKVEDMDGLLSLAENGYVDMCHTTTDSLGHRYSSDFFAFEMPFLFESHDHAAVVFDGPIGQAIKDTVAQNSNMVSLAFTYSGGYRMLASNSKCHTLEDLANQVQRVNNGPIAKRTFDAIGAKTMPVDLEHATQALANGDIDSSESTYPRFYGMDFDKVCNVINDTRHSLFVTNIMVSKEIWDTLTPEEQTDFRESAQACALKERLESLEDIELTTNRCKSDGFEVVMLSDEERAKWKELTKPMYDELDYLFTPGLINAIKHADPHTSKEGWDNMTDEVNYNYVFTPGLLNTVRDKNTDDFKVQL